MPSRARAATASHTGTGSALPFAAIGAAGRYSIASAVARYVASPTSTPSTGAAAWSRAAVLTTSPAAMLSPCSGLEVHSLGAAREPDEVGDQRGDNLAFLAARRGLDGERRPADHAEARDVWVFLPASTANRHMTRLQPAR